MILNANRIYLRPWEEEDARELYKYASNPNIGPSAGWPVHTSVENSKDIINNVLSKPYTYAVILKSSDKPIGSIGLLFGNQCNVETKEDEAELGYWIGEPYWGQGLIPEAAKRLLEYAFCELKLNKIWCGSLLDNNKSLRVQDKCGFKYVLTKENVPCAIEGQYNTLRFSCLTKDEWLKEK